MVLVMLTMSGGCADTTFQARAQRGADRVTAEQVCDALAADPIGYFRHVDVHFRDGEATLSGFVWEPQEIYRARQLTARVPGVKRVVNELELEQGYR
jgi:osmotically-inducible protein OsmY